MGISPEVYNEDYFERGLQKGVSCYMNYRWLPELTIPMAMTIIDYLGIGREHTILDFGCAKGYLVKAFRLLYRQAWGVDVSEYAIQNVDPTVKEYCHLIEDPNDVNHYDFVLNDWDFIIAKDVFEHISEEGMRWFLDRMYAKRVFAVIPLGDNGNYRCPVNDCDATHQICADETWWVKFFQDNGKWIVDDYTLRIDGIKDHYYEKYPTAHGFFILKRRG